MSLTYILVCIEILLLLLWIVRFHIKRRRIYQLGSKFKGPPTLPFLGNILQCLVPRNKIAKVVLEGIKFYKSPSRLWLGPYLAIHISNPEHLQIILNSPHCLEKPFLYRALKSAGISLFNSPVEIWKTHRRAISPIFSSKNLEGFFGVYCKYSKWLVQNLKIKDGAGVFNIEEYLNAATLRTVLETIFNFDDNDDGISHVDFMKQANRLQEMGVERFSNILFYFDFIYDRTVAGKEYLKLTNEFNSYMDKILEEWRTKIVKTRENSSVKDAAKGGQKYVTFVQHILSSSEEDAKFTPEELRDNVKTLLTAGMETSASAVGFTLLALGMYPKIQEKLYEEIIEIIGPNRDIEYEDIKHLSYLDMVVKESFRTFSPGLAVGRTNTEEIQLDEHAIIPADSVLLLGVHTLHRDSNIYPNPLIFDPDRFLPEEVEKRHPYSLLPFSAGPRNCIGWRSGLMTYKVFLIDLVRNYEITTPYKDVESVELTWMFLLKPIKGFNVSVKSRQCK